ncbi:MAG: VWA domain-containing protein [Erysipelotrichaceae bacterium]|nr:VWA domain-containing protein [Erysipelotrichaceae bacterium]
MDFNDFDDFELPEDDNYFEEVKQTSFNRTSQSHKQFDFQTFIISIIASIVGIIISNKVYSSLDIWRPLAIGIRIFVFVLIVMMVVFIFSLINGNLGFSHYSIGMNLGLLLIGLVIVLVISTILEGIYEINFYTNTYSEPSSYVFIIDNSGSMSTSDPDALRYAAIEDIISNKDNSFPYAIYSFSDSVTCIREVAAKSEGLDEYEPINSGGTAIKGTLQQLLSDYKDGTLTGLGDNPKFLLLSDGYATDIGVFSNISSTLKDYVKNNITISTVGLGNTDDDLMQQIALDTGGVYIDIDDAKDLESAMSTAITDTSDELYQRHFFKYRHVLKLDTLYAFMHIIFTAIIGMLISVLSLFATGRDNDKKIVFISGIVTSVIGALLLELGINAIGLPASVMTIIYLLLVGAVCINHETIETNYHLNKAEQQKSKDKISSITFDDDFNTGG